MSADRRRLAGLVLLAWGLLGAILVVTVAMAGLDAAGRAERLLSSSNRALDAAATSTRSAAEALGGVEGGIGQAERSAGRAATLASNASTTLGALADSMSLTILGTQPLLPLASGFRDSAADAAELADELGSLGGSLATTGSDTAQLADELLELATSLEEAATTGAGDPPPLSLVLAALLAWIALPTLVALAAGVVLVSGRRIG